MNNVFQLTKIMLKSVYDVAGSSLSRKRTPRSKWQNRIMILVLVGVIISSLFIPIYAGTRYLSEMLLAAQMNTLIWYLILPFSVIILLVLSIFTLISILFLSSDNKTFLPLPLRPWQILLARYFTAILSMYMIEAMILLPIMIGYGVGIQADFFYYLTALLVFIGIPVIPTALLGLLLTFIMRFVNLAKHKDLFTYISMFVMIGVSMGVSYFYSSAFSSFETDPSQAFETIQELVDSVGFALTRYVPFTIPAIYSMIGSDVGLRVLSTVGYLALNIGVTVLFIGIGGRLYLRSIQGSGEGASKRKVLTQKQLQESTHSGSIAKTYIMSEWRLMLRSPIYFSNLILIVILLPVIMFGSFFFSISSQGGQEILDQILTLRVSLNQSLPFMLALAAIIFFGSMNLISSTAISRMGITAPTVKYLPLTPMQQINYKIFWGVILGLASSVLLIVLATVIGVIPWYDALIMVPPMLTTYFAMNYLGILIDLKRPRLNWTNEATAVKSNLNSIIYMFSLWALTGIAVVIAIFFPLLNLPYDGYIMALLVTLSTGAIAFFLRRTLSKPSIFNHIN